MNIFNEMEAQNKLMLKNISEIERKAWNKAIEAAQQEIARMVAINPNFKAHTFMSQIGLLKK